MDKVIEILNSIKPGVDFTKEGVDLVEEGVIDSFDIVTIVGELNDTFDVNIGVLDFTPENFSSAANIYALVTRLSD